VRTALAAACALLGACDGSGGSEAPWPEGTVLGIHFAGERVAIRAEDVDEWLEAFAAVEPAYTRPALRRLALTNLVLPRAIGGLIDPAERRAARERAERARADRVAGDAAEPPSADPGSFETLSGGYADVGLDVWARARAVETGAWSPVFETVAGWCFFRLLEAPPRPWSRKTAITVERAIFPYLDLDPRGLIESAIDESRLTIVDPAWKDILPATYRYRMDG